MTISLHHIPGDYVPVSNMELDAIADRIELNDDRSSLASVADVAFLQFIVHLTNNTKTIGGKPCNVFDGRAHGLFGMYGDLAAVMMKDGRFRLSADDNLPWVMFGKDGADASVEMRQNENPVLASIHLAFIRLHNARMDAHGDEALARQEVVGAINKSLLNIVVKITQMDPGEILELGKTHHTFVNSAEWAFAAGRLPHPMVTETFAGNPLFTKMRAHEVPLKKLLEEDAGRPGLRIAPSMGRGDKELIKKTLLMRHNEHKLRDTAALAGLFGLDGGNKGEPIWSGLMEATNNGWDVIAQHAMAAGFGGMLAWAQGTEGVYMVESEGVPETLEEVVALVW